MKREVLYLEQVVTELDNVCNLDHVNLSLLEGEVIAVTGRDDSGMELLLDILSGTRTPDNGQIYVNGEKRVFKSPADANAAGIWLVRYENAVIPSLEVAENLTVLRPFQWDRFLIGRNATRREAKEMFRHYGISIDLNTETRTLTHAQCMMLHMCRAVSCGARILVCRDLGEEFTSGEIRELDGFIARLKEEGVSCILLNADLRKAAPVSDQVLVLRNGYICYNRLAKETDYSVIEQHMEIVRTDHVTTHREDAGEVYARFQLLTPVHREDHPLSFVLHRGETMGLLWKNGQIGDGIFRMFSGDLMTTGSITDDTGICSFADWFRKNRQRIYCLGTYFWETALFPNLTLKEHLLLRFYHHFEGRGLIQEALLETVLEDFAARYEIPRVYLDCEPRHMPSGVRNRIALWMALILPPKLLVIDNPLYGSDGQMQQNLLVCMEELKAQGTAILWSNNYHSMLRNFCERVQIQT